MVGGGGEGSPSGEGRWWGDARAPRGTSWTGTAESLWLLWYIAAVWLYMYIVCLMLAYYSPMNDTALLPPYCLAGKVPGVATEGC